MRVVYLSYAVPKPEFSDPEKWLKKIAFSVTVMEHLAKHVDVHGIYHIAHKGIIERNGVTYHFTNFRRWELLLPIQFNRYVKNLQPDVVIVYGLSSPWQIILLRWLAGSSLRVMVEHHADQPLRDVRQYLQRWADRYIQTYFFSSMELASKWVEKKQIGDTQKIVESAGASSAFYPIEKAIARASIGVHENHVFLWVGRLDSNKNPWLVVKAFERFAAEAGDACLLMIFSSADAQFDQRDFIREIENPRIRFVGEVEHDQLINYYNGADFIISSSNYESHGIAVVEGLSCGCVPVLTRLPSFSKMTGDGSIGFLYPPGDEEALVGVLRQCLEVDIPAQRSKILKWYEERLSGEAIADNVLKRIQQMTT